MQPTQPSRRPWVGCVKVAFAVLLRPHKNSSDNITDPATMQGNILRSKAVSLGPVFLQLLSDGSHRRAQRSWISHQRFYNTVLLSWSISNAKLLLNICYKCTHAYTHTHTFYNGKQWAVQFETPDIITAAVLATQRFPTTFISLLTFPVLPGIRRDRDGEAGWIFWEHCKYTFIGNITITMIS